LAGDFAKLREGFGELGFGAELLQQQMLAGAKKASSPLRRCLGDLVGAKAPDRAA